MHALYKHQHTPGQCAGVGAAKGAPAPAQLSMEQVQAKLKDVAMTAAVLQQKMARVERLIKPDEDR